MASISKWKRARGSETAAGWFLRDSETGGLITSYKAISPLLILMAEAVLERERAVRSNYHCRV
jgi:hypothetical protein